MVVPFAKVIVNPAAGGYAVYMNWPRINRLLRRANISFDCEHTEGIGHAMELARAAVDAGYQYLIVVGGDGTVNEVANGILHSNNSGNVILGILSAGTACSFVRSIGIPQSYTRACRVLAGPGRMSIDVGVVEYYSNGQSFQRFFVNEADVGFGAAVMEASRHLPRHFGPIVFGPSLNYALQLAAGLKSLFSYGNKQVTLRVGDEVEPVCTCAMVVVANGRYFGGGMYLAPDAKLDDGLLDVVVIGDTGKFELVMILPSSFDGSHITHPKIKVKKVTGVTVQSPEHVLVEADGEVLGEGPVTFRVVRSALTIVV